MSSLPIRNRYIYALRKIIEKIAVTVLLILLIWTVRYWYSAQFGLYEDDWTLIPSAVNMSLSQILSLIGNYIGKFLGQGRPLQTSMVYLFSFLGWKIGGLQGIYWIGFGFVSLNAILFYLLVKRIGGQALAILAALAYCLFSADTTQAFLTASLGLHPSLTLLLLAFHCYISNKRFYSYVLVFIILFSYETPFLVFLAAPIFKVWNKERLKEFLWHAGILITMLGSVLIFRMFMEETRVKGLEFPQIILTPILHMIQGPVVSFATYLYRPIQALMSLNITVIISSGLAFVIFVCVIVSLKIDNKPLSLYKKTDKKVVPVFAEDIRVLGRLLIAGLVMLIMAYPLTFTVRAYAITGRDTRVHFAAVVGAALLVGCFLMLILRISQTKKKKWRGIIPVATILSLLVGFGFLVQEDYIRAWNQQKVFWENVLTLGADMTDGSVIIVVPDGEREHLQIGANVWTTPRLLRGIYQFPESWQRSPRAYLLEPNWQSSLALDDGYFNLDLSTALMPSAEKLEVKSTNVIWLDIEGDQFIRRKTPVVLNGQEFLLKKPTESFDIYPKGRYYKFLFPDE